MTGYNSLNLNFTAGGVITAGSFVTISGNNTVVASAASGNAIGVAQTASLAIGDVVTVQADGISKVLATAAIAAGVQVRVGATSNHVVAFVPSVAYAAGNTNAIVGITLTAATAPGQIVEVLLRN